MKIKKINIEDIKNNKKINSKFLTIKGENLNFSFNVLRGEFYVDSFNYFPITNENMSFVDVFAWKEQFEYNHFFSNKFYLNFEKNKKNFKQYKDVFVLGSSPADNYFRNLITFIPRLFFVTDAKTNLIPKKINIAVHRNSSNKFRKFVTDILATRKIKVNKFIYLDNDFYHFKNSLLPQFSTNNTPIKYSRTLNILNFFSNKHLHKKKLKIYITRKNTSFRKLINEADIIDELKSNNFQIIDTDALTIQEQINIFSSAAIIIGATGSALTNIVFCNKGTKILEITPKYQFEYEHHFKSRYSNICQLMDLDYYSIEADPVAINKIDGNKTKFIDLNIINQSNYYKNLIIKANELKKFINKL